MTSPLHLLLDAPSALRTGWPARPLLRHGPEHAFADLLTLDQLERLVDTDCLTPRQAVLVKDGQRADPSTYRAGERLLPGTVRAHIEQGYTLSLRRLHETVPAISAFCHLLADGLGHPVQANAYRTPPGAQGFRHHWDTHTAVIAQLSGHKVWELYRPLIPDPMAPHQNWGLIGFTDEQRAFLEETAPDRAVTLRPGDVLWIPRGWVHNPHAPAGASTPSLHLTFGVLERTRYWLAEQLLIQAAEEPTLRGSLPPASASADRVDLIDDVRRRLVQWLQALDADEACSVLPAVPSVVSVSR